MLFEYNGWSKTPAIYEIRNRHSNRSYVGQTIEPKNRWNGHKNSLIRNKHRNSYLQADYRKCLEILGHDDFLEFHVIEALPGSTQMERNERELYWLNEYVKNGCSLYNLDFECDGSYVKSEETKIKISRAHRGRHLSDDHKAKISANAKSNPNYGLKGKKHSTATKIRISESRLGANHWQYGKKLPQKWVDKLKTIYDVRLISPDGKIYDRVVGLTAFAKEHGLSLAGLRFLLTGQRKSHKGWKQADDPVVETEPEHRRKQCSRCKEEKSLSSFNKKTESKDGKRSECRQCQNRKAKLKN
jgi:group I intron endonuclease